MNSAAASPTPAATHRPAPELRVLLIAEQFLFAQAIQVALRDQGMIDVAILASANEAEPILADDDRRPDVVVVDLVLRLEGALALGALVASLYPRIKVIGLVASGDDGRQKAALRAGFSGVVSKDTQVAGLVDAIGAVADGELVNTPGSAPGGIRNGPPAENGGSQEMPKDAALLARQLTGRELELLQLLSEGASSSQIAEGLHISRHTVRTHVQSVLGKLGVHSRLEAAAFAVRHGLVRTPLGASSLDLPHRP